jgi:hypothetical protein
MKTIFNALRKSLKEPQFIGVTLIDRQPDYRTFTSRRLRTEIGKDWDHFDYAINVYPKNGGAPAVTP